MRTSVVVDREDHAESDEGDEDFAEDANEDGPPALVTRSRSWVRRPTPAKAGRKAHLLRLPSEVSWPAEKKPRLARTEIAMKPRMNLGNFCQRKRALRSTRAAWPCDAQ